MSWASTCRTGSEGLKSVLMALANHARSDGTAAWPHVSTLADEVETSERTIQRRLPELVRLGFIRLGDQELVSHIRADKRPVVYDLAMSDANREEWAADAERGDNVSPRDEDPHPQDGVSDCHPADPERGDTPVTPQTSHGVTTTTPRGDNGAAHIGRTSPEPSPQPPAERGAAGRDTEAPAAGAAGCASCHGKRPCRACGTTPRQLERAELEQAAERRRQRADADIQASRRHKAETADVDTKAHAAAARRRLAEARR